MNGEAMEQSNKRKVRFGVVVGDAMDKTIIVNIQRQISHIKYGKIMRKNKKYYAHDEKNECKVGDRVRIVETRPLSKTKRWRVEEILTKAQ